MIPPFLEFLPCDAAAVLLFAISSAFFRFFGVVRCAYLAFCDFSTLFRALVSLFWIFFVSTARLSCFSYLIFIIRDVFRVYRPLLSLFWIFLVLAGRFTNAPNLPGLSLGDAQKLDDVREALRAGDVKRSARLSDRVYRVR
jgi:hypothetical protein